MPQLCLHFIICHKTLYYSILRCTDVPGSSHSSSSHLESHATLAFQLSIFVSAFSHNSLSFCLASSSLAFSCVLAGIVHIRLGYSSSCCQLHLSFVQFVTTNYHHRFIRLRNWDWKRRNFPMHSVSRPRESESVWQLPSSSVLTLVIANLP